MIPQTHIEVKLGSTAEAIRDGKAQPRVLAAIKAQLRKSMAEIQRHHKTQEMVRKGTGPAVPSMLTSRTGELSRSYRILMTADRMTGIYGSELRRARMLEEGGEIVPVRAGKLTIPTEAARVGVGAGGRARDYPGLFRPRGRDFLAKRGDDGRLIVMFWLVDRVTIPPRPTLRRTEERMIPKVEVDMANAIAKAVDSGA